MNSVHVTAEIHKKFVSGREDISCFQSTAPPPNWAMGAANKILRLSREAGDGTREAGAPGPDLATLHRGVGSGLRGLSINVIVSSNLSSNFLSLREDAVYKIQSLNLNASIKFDLKLPLNAFP